MTSTLQADRIQRAQDGGIELILLQPNDWDADPLLVKTLRERVAKQQEHLADPLFRLQHRAHSAQIILETMFAPPPELRRWLVTEGIELRPLDPEEEGPPAAIDRVQESGSLAEIILIQPLDWEADPFLMRQLRERLQTAITYTTSTAFRKRYPKKQPSFVLEVMFAPPVDLRDLLVDLGFMQIRPCEDPHILTLYTQQRSAKSPATTPSKSSPKADTPAASASKSPDSPKAVPAPQTSTPSAASNGKAPTSSASKAPTSSASKAPTSSASKAPTSSASKASDASAVSTPNASPSAPTPSAPKASAPKASALKASAPQASVSSSSVTDSPAKSAPSARTTPPAIPAPESWEDDLDEPMASPIATGPNVGMMVSGGVLLLFGLLWLGYALFGSGGTPKDRSPQVMDASQVSNQTISSLRIAQIAVRPDRMTFAVIPVQDPKTQKIEYYTLFADRKHRQLLILAPAQASQILKEWKDVVTNPDEPDRTTRLPVWQDDVQDPNNVPAARTYTGLLKTLRLRPSGPLELELPGENVNVNKISALQKLGVRFPENSMVLRVGEDFPPPPSVVIPVTLSLLLAAVGVFFLLAAFRRHSPA